MKKRFLILLLVVSLLSSLFAANLLTYESGTFSMYFLDLDVSADSPDKSGDATILISPDGKVMLLDSGHPECGTQVLQALRELGIDTIDIFVASHPHIDHIGGFPTVADNITINKVYRSNLEYSSQPNNAFLHALESKHIPTTILSEGDSFSFGDYIQVEVFNPPEQIVYPKDYPNNATQFINNNSLALKFTYGQSTAWFSGDLYLVQERKLLQKYGETIQGDVSKANHHGGDTSNSIRWIKNMRSQIVVAMHDQLDSMTVYNNYKKYGAEYHLTLNDGLVKVVMDDQKHYQVFDTKDSWMN